MVAEGIADIYPRLAPTMEWDTAAADAIVRESGCMSYQLSNLKPLTYNKPDLHNPWFVVKKSLFKFKIKNFKEKTQIINKLKL